MNVNDLVEDALRMAGVLADDDVTIVRDFPAAQLVPLDRHRALLILVNLIRNAADAMTSNMDRPRQLSVRVAVTPGRTARVTVADNGMGIPLENLTRIFVHGFTTQPDGHGFGLHSSALAAKEMGGSLAVHSDGVGEGAAFVLELPLVEQKVAV